MKRKITKNFRKQYNEYVDNENNKTSYVNGATAGISITCMCLAFISGLLFDCPKIAGLLVLLAGLLTLIGTLNDRGDKFDDHLNDF